MTIIIIITYFEMHVLQRSYFHNAMCNQRVFYGEDVATPSGSCGIDTAFAIFFKNGTTFLRNGIALDF